MSISAKTTALILLMGLLLSVSAFFIQRNVIYPAFHDIEVDYARNNIDRVVRRLEAQRETIDFTVYDWSAWNDTYSFIQSGDPEYIESNLYPDTFLNFGFDVALFLDLDGQPVWGRVFDFPPEGGYVDLSESYLEAAVAAIAGFRQRIDTEAYIDDQSTSGIVEVDGIPVLFAMRPIVKSDGSGPHQGYVVFGQFLDEELISKLSEQIVLEFSIDPVPDTGVPASADTYTLEIIDRSTLSASKIYSIEGTPGLRATAILPREITELGKEITFYGVALLVFLCALLAVALLALFRWMVVKPIMGLKADISSISNAMDYSLRASIKNNDEIGALSREFNSMLGMIESNNTELLRLNAELTSKHQKVLEIQSELQSANAELKRVSEHDPLTGLSNRLALEKKLKQAWEILSRTGDPLTVMLVDIDHFKRYNDRYGHQAGDDALKQVAAILESAVQRKSDMAARYGGEEFLLVLPGTDVDAATEIAASIRERIIAAGIEHDSNPVEPYLTISIGVSTVVPHSDLTMEDLVSAADKALYKVKESGRNSFGYEPVETTAQ
ncbi:diguanylate cyclase [Marinobacter panjinensis]|uniref:diguanylate cyclase n=1 Tax=Marinobacter panjinensis TaxID=2576384 RepID=A0A4V6CUG2_9GAMM|nr:diguanylate cyclase [Marinobacter panjinensis]MCR8914880.1 diguanylate cyclase [Marinobacter panjinensis]TKV64125.1 diguanylate cyclase [Marinobacter panjinensis]